MVWTHAYYGTWVVTPSENPLYEESDSVSAWSLHRLLCLYNVHYLEFMGEKEIEGAYDIMIDAITQAIEGGYFNEKYLV